MRRIAPPSYAWPAIAALLLLAGCGGDPLHATPHGLTVEEFASEPTIAAIEMPSAKSAGTWKGQVRKQWVETRDGGAPQTGRAVLDLTLERRLDGDVLTSRIQIAVASAEGLGKAFVRDFDGLALTLRHDENGLPLPATIRFEARATPAAQTFVAGFWLAGLTGVSPWLPHRPLRVGETWSRADLGAEAALNAVQGIARAEPRLLGGGLFEGVSMSLGSNGEDARIEVRLETLLDVTSSGRREALSLGILDRGHLSLDGAEGVPVRWSLEEHTRLNRVRGATEGQLDVVLRVDGELAPADR